MTLCLKHMYEEHPLWRCERQWHHMTYTTAGVLVLLCSDHKRDENNSVLFLHLGTGSQDRNPGCGGGDSGESSALRASLVDRTS